MKGDFTRSTFDPEKHYRSVRTQQGRVQMDADSNEQADISAYHDETPTKDIVGLCGVPLKYGGFKIAVQGSDLAISAGRLYVAGILCENETTRLISQQEDLPASHVVIPQSTSPPRSADTIDSAFLGGDYLAFIHVWSRHITALEDPAIREVALGGPDTATRTKTVWQVRLLELELDPEQEISCLSNLPEWDDLIARPTGSLAAQADPSEEPDEETPCIVPPGAGYRRVENQLYRVEVHQAANVLTNAIFKWSRDNGAVLAELEALELVPGPPIKYKLTVNTTGRDDVLNFAPGHVVELTDDNRELTREPGILVDIDSVEGNVLTVDPRSETLLLADFPNTPKVRRWDGELRNLTTVGTTDLTSWLDLEDGVQVRLSEGSYRTGDYWNIPARTIDRSVAWPRTGSEPDQAEPHGVKDHYCRLALLTDEANRGGGTQTQVIELHGERANVIGITVRNPDLETDQFTISEVFGAAETLMLRSAISPSEADVVSIPTGPGSFERFFYSPAGLFVTEGWKRVGSPEDAGDFLIPRDSSLFVERRGSEAVTITLEGNAVVEPTAVSLNQGFNFLSRIFSPQSTLESLGLRGQIQAGDAQTADIVIVPGENQLDSIGNINADARRFFVSNEGQWMEIVGDDELELAGGGDSVGMPSGYVIERRGNGTVITLTPPDSSLLVRSDCRDPFPPVTELTALYYVSGDGQEVDPGVGFFLPEQLIVGVSNGSEPVSGATVTFENVPGKGNGQLVPVDGGITRERGLARCTWRLDDSEGAPDSQQVIATLRDAAGDPVHLPIIFTANFDRAATDLGIHITSIAFINGDRPVLNDALTPISDLASGIRITADGPLSPESGGSVPDVPPPAFEDAAPSKPTCYVTLYMPYPLTTSDRDFWDISSGVAGFSPVVINSNLVSETDPADPEGSGMLVWTPSGRAEQWLGVLFDRLIGREITDRILARLTIKGNFIWDRVDEGQNPSRYLDGEVFGHPRGGRVGVGLAEAPSGDGRQGGDLEMWFWLRPDDVTEPLLTIEPDDPAIGLIRGTVLVDGSPTGNATVTAIPPDGSAGQVTTSRGDGRFEFPPGTPEDAPEGPLPPGIYLLRAELGGLAAPETVQVLEADQPEPVLLAHYPLEEDGGNIMEDISGNNRNGRFQRLQGALEFQQDGRIDQAIQFSDGARAVVPQIPLNASGEFTISLWVSSDSDGREALFFYRGNGPVMGLFLDDNALQFITGSRFDTQVTDGEWHHIAMTYNSPTGESRFFVDGGLVGDDIRFGIPPTGLLFFASDGQQNSDVNFTGRLDDIRIFAAELTEEQIGVIADAQ